MQTIGQQNGKLFIVKRQREPSFLAVKATKMRVQK
jgi:hypothetical protein